MVGERDMVIYSNVFIRYEIRVIVNTVKNIYKYFNTFHLSLLFLPY